MQGKRSEGACVSAVAEAKGAGESGVQPDVRGLWRRLRRRRKLMVVVAVAITIAGLACTFISGPLYESTARLLVSRQQAGLLNLGSIPLPPDLQGMLGGGGSAETEAAVLSDDQLLQAAYERLNPTQRQDAFGGDPELPDWAVKVKPKRGTDVVEVRVLSHSPEASAQLGRAIVSVYFERDFDSDTKATRRARRYAYDKMHLLEKQLSAANRRLAEYKKQTRLVAPQAQMDNFAEYVTNLKTTLDTELAKQAAGRRQIAAFERQISKEAPDVISGNIIRQNPRFAAGAATIDQLYSKRAEMMQEFQPQSQEMRSLDAQIKQEEARLQKTAGTIVDSEMHSRNPIRDSLLTGYTTQIAQQAATDASVAVLQREIVAQSKVAESLPEKERQLLELQGEVELLAKAHGLVSEQYYNLLLSEQQNLPRAQLLSNAIPDSEPVSLSLPASVLLYLLLGIFAALATGLVADRLDDRIQGPEDAERASGYFASAVVPLVRDGSPFLAQVGGPANMLESFRVLRSSVYRFGAEQQMKTIAVTSTRWAEGKTLTCANLAAAMAMDGRTVVVVDCNMEHPCVRELIGHSYESGLTHVLMGSCPIEKALVQGSQDGLFLVPSGPLVLNFPELLNSKRGRTSFAQLAERFDYVLIDCPPVSSQADMQSICSLAEGILLVTRVGSTPAAELASASASLSQTTAPIIGLVVNCASDGLPRPSLNNRRDTGQDGSLSGRQHASSTRPQ